MSKDLPPVFLSIQAKEELLKTFSEIGCHPDSLPILKKKGNFLFFQIFDLKPQAALILKQEALARGADVAIPWDALSLKPDNFSVLLMGNESQILSLCEKLKQQPFGLKKIGERISSALGNLNSIPKPSFFGGKDFLWGTRTFLMGIINLTPDSFSGDGLSVFTDKAIERALNMVSQGADIIDVGAESTRPGSTPVSKEEEWERLELFLKEFVPHSPVPVSLDTYKWEIAQKGLELGVSLINDVWGLKKSPQIAKLVADYGAGLILMHNKEEPVYRAFLPEVLQGLEESVEIALRAGVPREKIIVDPGFGFGKTAEHGYYMLKHLETFRSLGFPLLIGISRKSFIGKITGKPPSERVFGTAAFCALAIERGCDILRVHDVPQIKEVSLVCDRLLRQRDLI